MHGHLNVKWVLSVLPELLFETKTLYVFLPFAASEHESMQILCSWYL